MIIKYIPVTVHKAEVNSSFKSISITVLDKVTLHTSSQAGTSVYHTIPTIDWNQHSIGRLAQCKRDAYLQEGDGHNRPVSITCVCCKLLEHIVCSHIHDHLDKYNILTPMQHGFRKRHSCESQLIITLHDLMSYLDKKITVDVAILDLSKAFDTVPHDKLLHKISHYGVNGDLHSWISNFLTSRNQRVVVNGEHSDNI